MAARETVYQSLRTAQRKSTIALGPPKGPKFAQFRDEDAVNQKLCILAADGWAQTPRDRSGVKP